MKSMRLAACIGLHSKVHAVSMTMRLLFLALTAAALSIEDALKCREWAEAGECDSNEQYMRQYCNPACSPCVRWVARGECTANPHFMRKQCAEECECARRVAHEGCERVAVTAEECPEACAEEASRKAAAAAEAEAAAAAAAAQDSEECAGWAAGGECARNPVFMSARCAEACAANGPPSAADCDEWAARGECEANAAFMVGIESDTGMLGGYCAATCAKTRERPRCTAEVCRGVSPPTCLPGGGGVAPPGDAQRLAANAWALLNEKSDVAIRNEATTPVEVLWVDDGTDAETAYAHLQPGARTVIGSYLGHHWRVRAVAAAAASQPESGASAARRSPPPPSPPGPLSPGPLLLDTYANLVDVRSCSCEAHARDAAHYAPPAQGAVDRFGVNQTSRVLRLNASVEVVVSLWNGTAETEVARLHPEGAKAPNASAHRAVRAHPGTLLVARRAADGALLLQHLVDDIVVRDSPCAAATAATTTPAAASQRSAARESANGLAAAAAVATAAAGSVASKEARSRLQAESARLQRESDALRLQLSRLNEVDLSAVAQLPPELLKEYAKNATAALEALGKLGGAGASGGDDRGGDGTAAAAAAVGKSRKRKRSRSEERDEL